MKNEEENEIVLFVGKNVWS